jgi:hypothetical protein
MTISKLYGRASLVTAQTEQLGIRWGGCGVSPRFQNGALRHRAAEEPTRLAACPVSPGGSKQACATRPFDPSHEPNKTVP